MNMILQPAVPAEFLYLQEQHKQIAERCGNPGYLRGRLDNDGSVFAHSWEPIIEAHNTPKFKAEFNAVLDMLRFDERYGHVLENRAAMISYCLGNTEGKLPDGNEYAFRADTKGYSYLIRCIPAGEDHQVYIYPYRRDCLDRHMKQAEKGIRFVTPAGKKKFVISDGEKIQITTSGAGTRINTARYVDNCHFEVVTDHGSYLYNNREFAEWLKRHEGSVIPMRSTLPDSCYCVLPGSDEIIIVKKGESGYYRTDKYGHDRADALDIVDDCNRIARITKAQSEAMLAGSMFGWDTPAADPKNYDEQGQPIKPKQPDKGDAR